MSERVAATTPQADPVDRWLRAAVAEARRRGLPELAPLLEGLAVSTRELRRADWNDRVAPSRLGRPPGPSEVAR
jgi:hypothetical protein